MVSDAQKRARNKWDSQNMKLIGVKCKRELADEFEAICSRTGTTRNAVLLECVRRFVSADGDLSKVFTQDSSTEE